jgi:branched-chain amino acid transport system permease protein
MDQAGVPYWATLPAAFVVCFGSAFLMGFPALRLAGHFLALATFALALAVPQLLKYKQIEHLDRRRAGHRADQTRAAVHLPLFDQPLNQPTAGCTSSRWRWRDDVPAGLEPAARPRRPRAGGHPRPSHRRQRHGHQPAAVQVDDLRRVGRHHRGGRRARVRSWWPSWRPTASPSTCRSSCWWAWWSAGWRRSPGAIFGGIFIQFVPNIADEISKSAPAAIYGVVLIVFMYLLPTGVMGG